MPLFSPLLQRVFMFILFYTALVFLNMIAIVLLVGCYSLASREEQTGSRAYRAKAEAERRRMRLKPSADQLYLYGIEHTTLEGYETPFTLIDIDQWGDMWSCSKFQASFLSAVSSMVGGRSPEGGEVPLPELIYFPPIILLLFLRCCDCLLCFFLRDSLSTLINAFFLSFSLLCFFAFLDKGEINE